MEKTQFIITLLFTIVFWACVYAYLKTQDANANEQKELSDGRN